MHHYHGVGFYEQIKRLAIGDSQRDYAVIKYDKGDTLYVPVENLDSLSKFADHDTNPKLSRIGGAEFSRIKDKVRQSIQKMALDLSLLYAKRSQSAGFKFNGSEELLEQFISAFPFNETEDQLIASQECLDDLRIGKVMDRLLCGDVGFGKTEVALRAAFKVISEGKQVAFLAPTTILAKQHYNTVVNRMSEFGVKAASFTRFDSVKDIKSALDGLEKGAIDIAVGTHRLLSGDVKFKDIGLLILDEEQRFGVKDKEKIKELKQNVNVLTLSATPIPRTLHLSLSSIRDISTLNTPPNDRLEIKTFVSEYSDELIYDAVQREVNRGGGVFIVYNRVETMEQFALKIKRLLGENIKVSFAHGQMSGETLEDRIIEFRDGGSDVLIASTIIENGIDIPSANTMIVIDSDKFGLSQLYQLRGRVGRSNRLAFVYFTYDDKKILSENAVKRLEAIGQFTSFGSGYKIAMRDLQIRGAGNVLGKEQHGHIDKIGYETYNRILSEVLENKDSTDLDHNRPDVKVLTDFNAFIPDDYIDDTENKTRVYTSISTISSLGEKKELEERIKDIYGAIPPALDNLMLVALIKNLAAKINATSVTVKKGECFIKFTKTAQIPQSAFQCRQAKINLLNAAIHFGSDRTAMIKYLLSNINC